MAEAPQAGRRFSPEELDRLEDALESLEDVDLDLIEDESEAVRARLVDYGQILALSREALPLEDVPLGALDRVLEAARNPAIDELDVSPAAAEGAGGSWWSRFRKTLLIPALAVAGSAALILIIVQPTADSPPVAAEQVQAIARNDAAKKSDAAPPATPPAATPAEFAVEPEEAAAAAAPEPAGEDEDEPALREIATSTIAAEGRDKGADSPAPDLKNGLEKKAGAASADDAGKGEQQQAQTPRWDLIAQGDRARTDGDCATARRHYEAALSDTDDRVQARASAGLGLCEAQRGRQSAADELYERAKDLDPGISDFLNQQSPPGAEAPAKPRPSKKARKKSKRKASPEEQFDAFN